MFDNQFKWNFFLCGKLATSTDTKPFEWLCTEYFYNWKSARNYEHAGRTNFKCRCTRKGRQRVSCVRSRRHCVFQTRSWLDYENRISTTQRLYLLPRSVWRLWNGIFGRKHNGDRLREKRRKCLPVPSTPVSELPNECLRLLRSCPFGTIQKCSWLFFRIFVRMQFFSYGLLVLDWREWLSKLFEWKVPFHRVFFRKLATNVWSLILSAGATFAYIKFIRRKQTNTTAKSKAKVPVNMCRGTIVSTACVFIQLMKKLWVLNKHCILERIVDKCWSSEKWLWSYIEDHKSLIQKLTHFRKKNWLKMWHIVWKMIEILTLCNNFDSNCNFSPKNFPQNLDSEEVQKVAKFDVYTGLNQSKCELLKETF